MSFTIPVLHTCFTSHDLVHIKTYVKFSITRPLKTVLVYMLTNQISTGLMVKTNPHYTNQLTLPEPAIKLTWFGYKVTM